MISMRRLKHRLRLSLLCLAALSMILPVGCAPVEEARPMEPPGDSVIRIGINEPLTGANESGGNLELRGIQLAHELYPTVLGRKIELIVSDNRSDVALSADNTSALVEQNHVDAIIGSYTSSLSLAAGPIILEAQTPTVGGSCTNALVTAGNEFYFRVCFIDPFQGTVMANYAYDRLGAKSAIVVSERSSDYSVGLAKSFSDAFVERTGHSGSVLETLSYTTGDRDFSELIAVIAAIRPDVVFAPGNDTESALLITQARREGVEVPFLGGDTWETPEFLKSGGAAVEGVSFSTFYDPRAVSTDLGKRFVEAYRSKFANEPSGPTVNGFDAYMLLRDAMERAGTSEPQALRDALAKTDGFSGAGGPIQLDENRNAVKPAVILTVESGRFKYLDTINPR